MRQIISAVIAATLAAPAMNAYAEEFNYDEEKVPDYTLPDPLEGVASAKDWPARRAALYRLVGDEMFGHVPEGTSNSFEVVRDIEDATALDGKAVVSQPLIKLAGADVRLLIVRPAGTDKPVPAFLGYNFDGNHTVLDHPDIALTKSWMRKGKDHKADAADRGTKANRWDVENIVGRGYALVTLYYGDVDPDTDDGFKNGVHATLGKPDGPTEWGSIATWAWALSRVLDHLDADPAIDAKHVAVIGHSRLGKTSLWAGASDERFALVISNNSGCGGAALSRRRFGETVKRINTSFPHWFCDGFLKYNDKEDTIPFDQHTLLSLIAPRPVYVASAEGDRWADPRGEFLSCVGASPVYKLLGTEGLPTEEMPAVDAPVHGQIGYHIRTGKHDVKPYDWAQYLDFADKHFK